jgi:crotonobetainyl-CoA:carnitine CoA-transferase CaiB-like acyl-CoA transferase
LTVGAEVTAPLEGVRILDLSRVLAGPFCTMTLGDLGAEVIKVERPRVGDDLRHWGPPFTADGHSIYFLAVNRNKRSITIDLKREAGRRLLVDLAGESDVVVENFRHGDMDRFGLGYETLAELNPRLVYCSISGFGHTGPLRERPGYDVLMQAFSGLMSVTGDPDGSPQRVGVAIVDVVTGLYSALAIVSALQARESTGRGRRVDVSLLDAVLACLPNLTSGYLNAGAVPRRHGNRHPNAAPYGLFPTSDGNLSLAVGNDDQWGRLCVAMGQPELATDVRFASNAGRVARSEGELDELVRGWFRRYATDDLAAVLAAHGVPHSPIHSIPEVLAHPQVAATGTLIDVETEAYGLLRLVGSPILDGGSRASARRPPPLLGEHNDAVVDEVLGWDAETLERARAAGAFG